MPDERLRAALQQAGLQPEDLADELEVDVRTVRRWLSGHTVPNPRSRARTVALLNRTLDLTERDLWPEATSPPAGDDSADLVAIYTRGEDIRLPDWRDLLRHATRSIELLDTTLIQQFTTAGTIDVLRERARAGAQVRILTAHPDSIWITSLADQLGDTQRDEAGRSQLDRDLQRSHYAQSQLLDEPNIQLRTHWAERSCSILRFDDEMLATINLYATPDTHSPRLHLRRRSDHGIFDRLTEHLDAIWTYASQPLDPPLGTPA